MAPAHPSLASKLRGALDFPARKKRVRKLNGGTERIVAWSPDHAPSSGSSTKYNFVCADQIILLTICRTWRFSPILPHLLSHRLGVYGIEGGGTERIRTSDLAFRKRLLYPAELRPHGLDSVVIRIMNVAKTASYENRRAVYTQVHEQRKRSNLAVCSHSETYGDTI